MEITRKATLTVMRAVEIEVEGVFKVRKVIAGWEADRGKERWVVSLKSDPGDICIIHYASEDEAKRAVESGLLDEYLEDEDEG